MEAEASRIVTPGESTKRGLIEVVGRWVCSRAKGVVPWKSVVHAIIWDGW